MKELVADRDAKEKSSGLKKVWQSKSNQTHLRGKTQKTSRNFWEAIWNSFRKHKDLKMSLMLVWWSLVFLIQTNDSNWNRCKASISTKRLRPLQKLLVGIQRNLVLTEAITITEHHRLTIKIKKKTQIELVMVLSLRNRWISHWYQSKVLRNQ